MIVPSSDIANVRDQSGGTVNTDNTTAWIAGQRLSSWTGSVVWFFELPDLGGQPLGTVDLSLFYAGNFNDVGTGNLDLYYLDVRDAATATYPGDYGYDTTTPTGSTLLVDDWLTPASTDDQFHTLSSSAQSALALLINTEGYVVGDFLTVAAVYDSNNGGNDNGNYEVGSDESGETLASATFTVVPEPSAFALLLSALGLVLLIRRHR